jgi:hypothetical protein
MRKFLSLFLLVLITIPAVAKSKNEIPQGYILFDKIVAIVNGTPILQSEVKLFQEFYNIPNEKEALQKLINQILLSQAAERMGLKATPEEINMYLENLAKRNGLNSVEDLLKLLSKEGVSIVEFKNLIRRQILINKFVNTYIRDKILEGIETGKTEEIATIQIIVLDKNSSDFKKKYENLKKELGKVSFAKLFSKYNEDKSLNENNGVLKNIKKGFLAKALDQEIWKHKKGEIFEVDTPNKVYFIKIIDKKRKLSEIGLSEEELNKKIQEEIDILLEKLKENSVIKYLN